METERINLLLVEDNPDDVFLTKEAFKDSKFLVELDVLMDGEKVLDYLDKKGKFSNKPPPDLILLDLNLPKKDGRTVLKEIKTHPTHKVIPVVVLTTSSANEDILESYKAYANSYVQKPVDFDQFIDVIHSLDEFWFTVVRLPKK